MFNIGPAELIAIAGVALIVLGPQRLPQALRSVGRVVGELRRISGGFQDELRRAIDESETTGGPADGDVTDDKPSRRTAQVLPSTDDEPEAVTTSVASDATDDDEPEPMLLPTDTPGPDADPDPDPGVADGAEAGGDERAVS